MTDSVQVAAFEGGQLRLLSTETDSAEAVLALPLNRLIGKMVRVPAEEREDPVKFATPILQAMSPYPDEPLTVSCETVRDDESGLVVIAMALPESATDDIAEALDGAKLNINRVDSLFLGQIRGLWPQFGDGADMRRLVIVKSADCLSLMVLDGEQPSAIRAVNEAGELKREIMLSLLEAEDFGGAKALGEIVLVGDLPAEGLEDFAPVRRLEIGEDAGLVGVAERTADAGALNALPASWAEVLAETRFKKKLYTRLGIAGGIWALIMAVLFGVPMIFGYMTDHQHDLCKEHSRQYTEVREMKSKCDIVGKYSDHSRGALEIMKAVSDRLPQGIELDSWNYRHDEGLRFTGVADEEQPVYDFKDVMSDLDYGEAEEGEEAEKLFNTVKLGPLSSSKGRQKFNLELLFEREEEE